MFKTQHAYPVQSAGQYKLLWIIYLISDRFHAAFFPDFAQLSRDWGSEPMIKTSGEDMRNSHIPIFENNALRHTVGVIFIMGSDDWSGKPGSAGFYAQLQPRAHISSDI